MLLALILLLLLGCIMAALGAVYCFNPDMIVRQAHDVAHRTPRLLHFALPIRPRLAVSQPDKSVALGSVCYCSAPGSYSLRSWPCLVITDLHAPTWLDAPLPGPLVSPV